MRIGILGSGDVGRALGAGFVARGHQVTIGTREPAKLDGWLKQQAGKQGSAAVGSFADTAARCDLAVLATLWSGTEAALELAGPGNLIGKVVIDATNPLVFAPGKPPALALGHTDSGGEQVQRWLPTSKVVKAYNTVGHAHMVDPQFAGGPPDLFIAGNDSEAKRTVTGINTAFGWSTIDLGDITAARLLEPMCIVWVLYGLRTQGWNHAFKLLKK
jgi:predicted dinucleotide-binding enzyme